MPNPTHPFRIILPLFVVLVIVLLGCTGSASIQQNPVVSTDKLELLRNKTILFIIPENENKYFEDYVSMLPKAWTITPIEVIKYKDLGKYSNAAETHAFFTVSGIKKTTTSQTGSRTNVHYFLTLSLPYATNKKGVTKTHELCRIELYPDTKTVNSFSTTKGNEVAYSRGEFRNFNLPYMLSYLRFVQNNLQNGKDPNVYNNYTDAQLKAKLVKDTLYVPTGLLYDRNMFSGAEEPKEKNFFQSYSGTYKYVSPSELINIIKNRPTKPIFLFEYVLSSTDKYVGVLEVNSGTVVHRKYTPLSYNIKSKDLKAILE